MRPVVRRLDPGDEAVAQELEADQPRLRGGRGRAVEGRPRADRRSRDRGGDPLRPHACGHRRGRITGCLRTRAIDATTADAGLIAAAPDAWGAGTGRALLDAAETFAHSRGATTMRLELFVPRTGLTPTRSASAWYTRRGYTVVKRLHRFLPRAPLATSPENLILKHGAAPTPTREGRHLAKSWCTARACSPRNEFPEPSCTSMTRVPHAIYVDDSTHAYLRCWDRSSCATAGDASRTA